MNHFYNRIASFILGLTIILMQGCAATGETMITLLETPTVEASANRSAVGASEIRINNYIINHMPISADAEWPSLVNKEATDEQNKIVRNGLKEDPWFATRHYSDPVQRKMLGGSISPGISPLTYDAYKKISILYGPDSGNWPNVLKYSSDLDQFLEFVDSDEKQPLPVEAKQAKLYPNIYTALISLMPVNFQKDLKVSNQEMQQAFSEVAKLKAEKADIKHRLDEDSQTNDEPLDEDEIKILEEQVEVLEVQIEEKEKIADEKQDINFTLLDSAVEKLESEITLTSENVALAKNIQQALEAVKSASLESGTLYTLSLASLIGKNTLANFDKELLSLAEATAYVPVSKRHLMKQRIVRLKDNLLYLFPSIGMGSYYAIKQYNLASKYSSVTEVIISASDAQSEMNATSTSEESAVVQQNL